MGRTILVGDVHGCLDELDALLTKVAFGEGDILQHRTPKPTSVIPGDGGSPRNIAGRAVDCVREEWVVEDRWWTGRPLRRSYFELVTVDGASRVVFRDLESDRWYAQGGA